MFGKGYCKQWSGRPAGRRHSFRADESAHRAGSANPQRSTARQFAIHSISSRLRWARLGCLIVLLASTTLAQEVLSIPVNADGELQPPPGVELEQTGVIDTLAGTGQSVHGGDGGPAIQAQFSFPRSLALDPMGNIYVVDTQSHRIRRINTAGEISTFAGTGEDGDGEEDGKLATETELSFPAGVATDAEGNVYVADSLNHRIRKIDVNGIMTTIAGTGAPYSGGDGGPATEAQIPYPVAVASDARGYLYVAEGQGHRIRRIDVDGTIATLAGTGLRGYSGDGGPASRARLAYPAGIVADSSGNVYIADSWNHRVRRIRPSGIISTIAGTGERADEGDGGPALQAQVAYPVAVATDMSGNLYVVSYVPDKRNHRIRKIDADGTISAFAGGGVRGFGGDGDPALVAQLAYPLGIAADTDGNVYIADSFNARIRIVRPELQVRVELGASGESAVLIVGEGGVLERGGQPVAEGSEVRAGNGNSYTLAKGSDGAPVATYLPETQRVPLTGGDVALARDEDGTWRIGGDPVENGHRHLHGGREFVLEIADGSWRLAEYTVETVAGTTRTATDGIPATSAILNAPIDVAVDRVGNVYVAEWFGHRVRKIGASETIMTIAGTGDWGSSGDGGSAVEARLNHPFAIATGIDGDIYVAERDGRRVRKIDRFGVITTVAGTGGEWGSEGDGGPATEAWLPDVRGLAVDSQGNVLVAAGEKIRRIDNSGTITTFAGTGEWGFSGDGGPAVNAELGEPHGLAFDTAENLYLADWHENRIRRIDRSGVITTFAGTGELGSSGDGGLATHARLHHPLGVSVDLAGNVYVAEDGGGRIRRIDTAGVIKTVAGTGTEGFSGEVGSATEVDIHTLSVAAAADGSVYVADTWNGRVRKIDGAGMIRTVAGTWPPEPVGGPGTEVLLENPRGVVVRPSGELVFGEWGSLWRLNAGGEVERFQLTADGVHTDLEGLADIALDTAGNLYVAEQDASRIRRIDSAGKVTPFAGTGVPGDGGDGRPAIEAQLVAPVSVAVDSLRNVYVADREGHRVRKIDRAGIITAFAGTGDPGSSGNGGPAIEAQLESPVAVAVDRGGNVFIADRWGWLIRKVDRSGLIHTFAELGVGISEGSLATDSAGRLYAGAERQIWRIDADGEGSVIAGTSQGGYGGDGGPALSAGLSVHGIAVGRSGQLWFADRLSRRIRVLRRQVP